MAQQQPQQTSGKTPKDCQECGCRCESCSSTGHGRSSILTTTTNTDGTIGPSSSSSGPSSVSTAQQSFNNSSTQSKHGTGDNVVVHLYQEIENLKRQISERDYHIVQMETTVMNHAKEYPNGEFEALQETLRFWQEKYERLFESHRKLQKVNQALEDKLLRIVDKFETEKAALTRDVADLTTKLVEARVLITELEEESELYKNDCNIAVQLLQCKPSNFVSHKVNSLPSDIQEKVRLHFGNSNNHRRSRSIPSALSQQAAANHHHLNTGQYHQLQSVSSSSSSNNGNNNNINNNDFLGSGGRGNQVSSPNGAKIIRVPIPTFPPTAMVYSVNKVQQNSNGNTAGNGHQNGSSGSNPDGTPDYVSAAIMAKVLEERSKERNLKTGTRYQKCFQCRNRRVTSMYYDETTQTTDGHITPEDFTNYPWSYWNSNSSSSENNNKRRSRNESSDSGNSLDSLGNHHLHGAQLSHQQQHQQQQQQHQSQQYYQYQQQPSQQQQQQLSQLYPQQHQTITSSYSSSSINSSSGSNSSTGNNYYGNTTTGAVTTVKKKSNETIII